MSGARTAKVGQRPVRLADVAERLGLTAVAVSKALRDLPDISAKTRETVKRTAAEMGYVPNYFAKSLQSNRSNVLGVIVPQIRHPFFAAAIAGIQNAAVAQKHEMLLAISDESAAAERQHIETFLSMRTAGLLISAVDDPQSNAANAAVYRKARLLGTPLVFFDRAPIDLTSASAVVAMDDRGGAFAAVTRAVERGYRGFAHVAGSGHLNIGAGRRAGYEDAIATHGLRLEPRWTISTSLDERSGYDAFVQLWSGPARPDAIFFATSPQMLGAMDAMRALGVPRAERPLVLYFGLPETMRFCDAPYVCAAQPAIELGNRAVEEALRLLRQSETEAPSALVHIQFAVTIIDDCD